MDWSAYWVWFAGALVLGILEILVPGYILLGFAIAAAGMGVLFLFSGGFAEYLASSMPITLVVFGVLSLIVWLIIRRIFGKPGNQVKIWETDINDN